MSRAKIMTYAFLGGLLGTAFVLFLTGTFFTNLSTVLLNTVRRAFYF